MYTYFNIYGESANGIEPTEDLETAVKNANSFELIVYDTELKMDVYDIRKEMKWNPKWLSKRIMKKEAEDESTEN